MSERTNYSGHYSQQLASAVRPQGIVFRKGIFFRRYSPYMWLVYAEYQVRELKLDFGSYDVVVRSNEPCCLADTFEAITRHECGEISEMEGKLSIEIIEKEEEREEEEVNR